MSRTDPYEAFLAEIFAPTYGVGPQQTKDSFALCDYGPRAVAWWAGSDLAKSLRDHELFIVLEFAKRFIKTWRQEGRPVYRKPNPADFDNDPMVLATDEYLTQCGVFTNEKKEVHVKEVHAYADGQHEDADADDG